VVASFQAAFVGNDGSILDSSQTGYALAFSMDLLPPAVRAQSADIFVHEIAKRDWHLATGFIGTPRLLPALHLAGRDDVAYRLLLQDTYPSWLFQVRQGATTMWERWDGWTPDGGFQSIEMNSFNHYAFGSVGEYLYRFVAGIDTDGPGFRRITIAPQPRSGLTSARARFNSPAGEISSAWEVAAGQLRLDVTIPPNTWASVRLPTGDPSSVRLDGQPRSGGTTPDAVTIELGSGTYHFEAAVAAP
jgi:alpha-L-rhamnosidase